MLGYEEREIRGNKALEGLGGQDKEFVLDMGIHWEPVEECGVTYSERQER